MGFGSEEGLHQKVCSNCGLRWVPVQRAQCINCGSDAGPIDEEKWVMEKKDDGWDIPIKETPPDQKARMIVGEFVMETLLGPGGQTHHNFTLDDVKLVWFNYTLGGWKAMVITTLPDNHYYEVTYNKEKRETYLDAYKKFHNMSIPD